jgi:choline dehydrogenase-like flavoprotein
VEAGKSVILLERGGYYEGKDMNQLETDMIPLLWKIAGFNFDDKLRVVIAQGCCLGGSTIINDAVCFDPPARLRDEWRLNGVNFTEEEWNLHLKKVNETLSVYQVTEDELNRNNKMLRKGAKKIGMKEHKNNFRNCINCMQCGFCHLGCHYDTKQNVLVTYIHQALTNDNNSNLKIYWNCHIDKIVYDNIKDNDKEDEDKKEEEEEKEERNEFVKSIEGNFVDIDGNNKFKIKINSNITIISAGAIASSELLLKSKISTDIAGKGLCLHPGIEAIGDFNYEIKGNQGVPMAYTIHDFGNTRKSDDTIKEWNHDGNEFLIESIFLPFLQFSIALTASGPKLHNELISRINSYAMDGIVVRDNNLSQVYFTNTGRLSVQYEPGLKELKALTKGIEVLGKMWFALGANKIIGPYKRLSIIESEEDIPKLVEKILQEPKNLLIGSAHPQSGNKIGMDPKDSVVDSDCKVHGFKIYLYVMQVYFLLQLE